MYTFHNVDQKTANWMQEELTTNCINLNSQRIKHGKDTILVIICAYIIPMIETVRIDLFPSFIGERDKDTCEKLMGWRHYSADKSVLFLQRT